MYSIRLNSAALIGFAFFAVFSAHAQTRDYPPRLTEIRPEVPLFVFHTGVLASGDTGAYGLRAVQAWNELPAPLRPYSVLQVEAAGADLDLRMAQLRDLLLVLQTENVPTVVRICDGNPATLMPLERIEELLQEFTCIQGIEASGLQFAEYYEFGAGETLGILPSVRWLMGAVNLAASYGRIMLISLDELHWARIMSNAWCRPLYEMIRQCRDYVVPLASTRGDHHLARMGAVLGLWLEGGVNQWGIESTSLWYSDAPFISPGVFGNRREPGAMPESIYRAMILCGAMSGATVYAFSESSDLWFGTRRRYWDSIISPTLREIVDQQFVAREEFVRKKARVAYQLAASRTSEDFHFNLRDIDPVLDRGVMIAGAYGVEDPGQIPELIPNSGRHYWVPILSPYATLDSLDPFAAVVRPGEIKSAAEWTQLLDRNYEPDGGGVAFVTRIGRGIFILNTSENIRRSESFSVPGVPAPVRGLTAEWKEDGVHLAWGFRDNDVSYNIYRRVAPEIGFSVVARDVSGQRWVDTNAAAGATIAYAVTAFTTEEERFEGTVSYGEYLVLSTVESRVEMEAVVSPALRFANEQPVRSAQSPTDDPPPWPSYDGAAQGEPLAAAQAIAARIEDLEAAIEREDLNGVMDVYQETYQDPQGWGYQYAQRAFQWFFERYSFPRLYKQIRRWDFSGYEQTGQVRVLVFCKVSATAITDASGRFADVRAFFPQTESSEILLTFDARGGAWRIIRSEPAFPNFADVLRFSAGPYDDLQPGPDIYSGRAPGSQIQ